MMMTFRAAMVIARRDYVATVWSRAFLFFLLGPLFPIIFGMLFGAIGSRMGEKPEIPTIAVIAAPAEYQALLAAHDRLGNAFPLARLAAEAPGSNPDRLLDRPGIVAVLDQLSTSPRLTGTEAAIAANGRALRLFVDGRRRAERLGSLEPTILKTRPIAHHAPATADHRADLARGVQLLLLLLTMILAGMLLSNLIEEKSSKVIEILAAAVPVDAIFLGKLVAMLGMSLTGITVWATIALTATGIFAPYLLTALATPAVGWPVFIALGIAYFIACYLLLGALFLGIGGQAATVREVQTLSMPVTMGQLIVFALAAASVEDPDNFVARIAAIFPWSSPFTMIGRAALRPEIWPHFIALIWQGLWITLIIRVSAGFFRRSVLKSGKPRRWFRRRAET